jgi:hypothetical protein
MKTTRKLYAVRKTGTNLWAPLNGWPFWDVFENAQIYVRKNPATARRNAIEKCRGEEAEVVELICRIAE